MLAREIGRNVGKLERTKVGKCGRNECLALVWKDWMLASVEGTNVG